MGAGQQEYHLFEHDYNKNKKILPDVRLTLFTENTKHAQWAFCEYDRISSHKFFFSNYTNLYGVHKDRLEDDVISAYSLGMEQYRKHQRNASKGKKCREFCKLIARYLRADYSYILQSDQKFNRSQIAREIHSKISSEIAILKGKGNKIPTNIEDYILKMIRSCITNKSFDIIEN